MNEQVDIKDAKLIEHVPSINGGISNIDLASTASVPVKLGDIKNKTLSLINIKSLSVKDKIISTIISEIEELNENNFNS